MIQEKISIIGAGSWGTTVGNLIARNRPDLRVDLWAYEKDVARSIKEQSVNRRYLPNVLLANNLHASTDLGRILKGTTAVILVPPSRLIADMARKIRKHLGHRTCPIAFMSKGFCRVEGKNQLISETLEQVFGDEQAILAISGPSHAEEVSRGDHTCLTIAGRDQEIMEDFRELLEGNNLSCRFSQDIRGVELGGTLKNPAAIAAGILSYLPDCGDNIAGALISEAVREMIRLGNSLGAREETILNISGLGDLVTTALSDLSRNRRFGIDIAEKISGRGKSNDSVSGKIIRRIRPEHYIERLGNSLNYLAEGAYAIEPIIQISEERNIDIPVYRALYEVLLNRRDISLLIETIKNPESFEQKKRESGYILREPNAEISRMAGTSFRKKIQEYARSVLHRRITLTEEMKEYRDTHGDLSERETEAYHYEVKDQKDKILMKRIQQIGSSMVDRYSFFRGIGFNILKRKSGTLMPWNRKRLTIERAGKVKKNLKGGVRLYLVRHETPSDPIASLLALKRVGMKDARFPVEPLLSLSSMQTRFLRRSGGYLLDRKRLDDPIYRLSYEAYLSTLLEYGIDLIMGIDSGKDKMEDLSTLLHVLDYVYYRKGMDVLIIPQIITRRERDIKRLIPDGTVLTWFPVIRLSEYVREGGKIESLSSRVEDIWSMDPSARGVDHSSDDTL